MQDTPTPADVIRLRVAYGTQPDAARALGVAERTLRSAETQADYPRRRLVWLALRGLLAEEGLDVPPAA